MSVVKILRVALIILAGLLLGAGGLLLGQVHVARIMEERVDSTFFLFRAIGYATFAFQGSDVQVALAIKDLPAGSLEHSERVAWFAIAVGSLFLLAAPFLKRRKRRT
ncbi:MAG: hypothetical protein KDC95_04450 [Planctomycetes bacterium]|nr:hypothetical protein [Planctomycetota bacterium]